MWTEGINSLPHGVVGRNQQEDAQPSAGTNPLHVMEKEWQGFWGEVALHS